MIKNCKIDLFAICYNEEFMLPHFIQHYKKHFNANITIMDNNSTDKSRAIVEASGGKVLGYDSKNQIRDDIYLQIKNSCWKQSSADWVIVCDIDEFLEIDFDIKPYTVINSIGYDIVGGPESRKGVPNTMMNKTIMFKPAMVNNIRYNFGCHAAEPTGFIIESKTNNHFAKLLHRKYISEEHLYNKHKEYEARLSDLNKQYGWGVHYQNTTKESIQEQFKRLNEAAVKV